MAEARHTARQSTEKGLWYGKLNPHAAIRHIIGWAVIAIIVACSPSSPEQTPQRTISKDEIAYEGTIVAVGDSLTAGLGVAEDRAYPAQLARKLHEDGHLFKVVNAGVSGETSSGALSRIQWVIESLDPDIVILETGANDGLRGIDPTLLESNLNQLVVTLKKQNIIVVFAGMQMLPNLGPDYIEAFATIYPKIAQTHDVIFMPFFLEGVAGQGQWNQPDKIHPTAEGYTRIVANLYPYVLQAIDAFRQASRSAPQQQ